MTTGRVNVGGGGGGASLNIYTQLSEPQKKDGIWLQTSDKFRTIFLDTAPYVANSWVLDFLARLPTVRENHTTVLYNDYIYVFGGRSTSIPTYQNTIYKYSLKTGVWTYVGATQSSYLMNHTAVIKDGILYFAGRVGSTTAYLQRFDLATETWLPNTSTSPRSGDKHVILDYGPDKLIICVLYTSGSVYIYEYTISTNSWKQINASGYGSNLAYHAIHLINNVIYFAGGDSNYYGTTKYDILTDKFISTANTPLRGRGAPSLAFGTDIHIYGTGDSNTLEVLIYDTLNNVYTYGPPMLRKRDSTQAVFDPIRKKVYLVGGNTATSGTSGQSADTDAFTYISKQYTSDELVLLVYPPFSSDPRQMAIQLFGTRVSIKNMRFLNYFLDAWIFKNGDLKEYPAYYGDGTKWTKFKN
jgi:hypothetical protein